MKNKKKIFIKNTKNKGKKKPPKQEQPTKRTFTPEEKEKINELDGEVHHILKNVNRSEKALTNRESEFKKAHLGEDVTIVVVNGKEITGKLIDIDKYRVEVEVDGIVKHYYKHSLVGYFPKED